MRSKERHIQNILFESLVEKTNKLIVPNVKLYWWESDLMDEVNSVTDELGIDEFGAFNVDAFYTQSGKLKFFSDKDITIKTFL